MTSSFLLENKYDIHDEVALQPICLAYAWPKCASPVSPIQFNKRKSHVGWAITFSVKVKLLKNLI